MKKYAIWNNKGGVGKTFLTFVVATKYAQDHPKTQVVVIDMCPQANVSEILLGGNGAGSQHIDAITAKWEHRRTIGGYFDKRLSQPDQRTGNEIAYCIQNVSSYAKALPENLHLVCGDRSLELQVQSINQLSSVDLPEDRWRNVHTWLIDLQNAISTQFNEQVAFFIDCNPSFATYTAQALLASDRLIVPCTADGSSARAFDNISQLLYGIDIPKIYEKRNFAAKLKEAGLVAPRIHLVPLNRSTINKDEPASAFSAMYDNIQDKVTSLSTRHKELFTPAVNPFISIPDAHTVAIVASHKAVPLDKIEEGKHHLGSRDTQVSAGPLNRYRNKLNEFMSFI